MNRIDNHSRVDEGVTVRNSKINRLVFADDLVRLASSQQGLQHALGRFSAAFNQVGMKISPKNTKILCIPRKPNQCTLQVAIHCSKSRSSSTFGGIHEWRKQVRSHGGIRGQCRPNLFFPENFLYRLFQRWNKNKNLYP